MGDSNGKLAPPPIDAPRADWARFYVEALELAIVHMPARTKAPKHIGWNDPGGYFSDATKAQSYWSEHPADNMGAVLGPSRLLSLDVDAPDHTRCAFAAAGFDLDAILKEGVAIEGNPKKGKRFYRAPDGLALPTCKLQWPGEEDTKKKIMVVELRTGRSQDLLPPSLHPLTEAPYRWLPGRSPWDLGGIPGPPDSLLRLWQTWDTLLPMLLSACPWRPEPKPEEMARAAQKLNREARGWDEARKEILRRLPIREVLARIGVTFQGERAFCPMHPAARTTSAWLWRPVGADYEVMICAHGGTDGYGVMTKGGYGLFDVIALWAWRQGIKPGKATAELARELGIRVHHVDTTIGAADGEKESAPPDPTATVPAIRGGERLVDPPTEYVVACYHREEFGDGELFARLYEGRVLFDASEKAWHLWAGHAWKSDRAKLVRRLVPGNVGAQYLRAAADAARQMEAETDPNKAKKLKETVDALIGRAKSLRKLSRTQNVLGFAEALLPTTGEDWDADPWLLGVPNGVIDLRDGKLRPGAPNDRIRTACPTPWTGLTTPTPRWEAFLREVFDREDPTETDGLVGFVHRLLGYGTTGLSTEHVLPVLWGKGRNGKDTLLDTLAAVLGPLAGPATTDLLVAESGRAGSASPHLYDLRGKRLVWASETNEGARLNAGRVKFVTGGGRQKARPLYGNPVEWEPTHLLLLVTNFRPHAGSDDYALWKRLALVPFVRSFVTKPDPKKIEERKSDPRLKERLIEEKSGILAWLVRGCLAWQERGFDPPACVQAATEKYREEEDMLARFVEACCVQDAEQQVSAKALYGAYERWAGKGAMSQTSFGKKMGLRFSRSHTAVGEVYGGLRLTDDWAGRDEGFEGLKGDVLKSDRKTPPSRGEDSKNPSDPSNRSETGEKAGS